MHLTTNVENYLARAFPLIEKTLDTLFSRDFVPYGSLFNAARYALEGGKRLRPLLMLAMTEAFDIPLQKGLYPACALELIHCYSLIHDDLPCMDDDDFRRGKPSLHRAFPESHAILTGDYLLTYAFEILCIAPDLTSAEKISLLNTISHHAGSKGMIGGQIMDIEAKNKPIDYSSFLQMQIQKTGSLFMASLEFGAILAHQNPIPYKKIGKNLGLAYQIYDDIADVDKENHHANILSLLGEKQVYEYLEKLYRETFAEIHNLGPSLTLLGEFVDGFIFRKKLLKK